MLKGYLRLGYRKNKELKGYEGFLAYRNNRHDKDIWKQYSNTVRKCIMSALQDAAFMRKDYMELNGLDKVFPKDYEIAGRAHIDILGLY